MIAPSHSLRIDSAGPAWMDGVYATRGKMGYERRCIRYRTSRRRPFTRSEKRRARFATSGIYRYVVYLNMVRSHENNLGGMARRRPKLSRGLHNGIRRCRTVSPAYTKTCPKTEGARRRKAEKTTGNRRTFINCPFLKTRILKMGLPGNIRRWTVNPMTSRAQKIGESRIAPWWISRSATQKGASHQPLCAIIG